MKTKTILILTFITFLLIGLSASGTYIFLKSYTKTEDIVLPSVINSVTNYPNLQFSKTHKIKINNQEKTIFRSYQILPSDLKEGENIINISRYSSFSLSGDEKLYTVFVDRLNPDIKLSYKLPTTVINKAEILLPIDSEDAEKYFINDNLANYVNGKLSTNLKEGENNIRIASQDKYGNMSKPLELSIFNDKSQKWKQNTCGDFYIQS